MAKESAWWKYDAPGSSVTGILPALTRSGSTSSPTASGPMPSMPFSVCSMTPLSGARWLATLVGRPIPRLTNDPAGMSAATMRARASRSMPLAVVVTWGLR
jgi:hypothetical protein